MEEISLKPVEGNDNANNNVLQAHSDKQKKIILNTNGYCFLCSKIVESDTLKFNKNYLRKSFSLKSLHRHLQLNFKRVLKSSFKQFRSCRGYEELHVQICEYCDNLMSRFSDSFSTLEVIQMETSYWLDLIQKQISETINQPESETSKRLLVDDLRKQIKTKSLKLKNMLQPKVILSKEETLSTSSESSDKTTKTARKPLVSVKVEEPDDDASNATQQNEVTDSFNEASSSSSSPLPKSKANTETKSNTGNRPLLPSEMYVKNSKTGTYDCIVCKKKFGASGNAVAHCKYTHFPQEYKCDLCGASYTRPEVVKKHRKICNGIKPSWVPRGSKTSFNKETGKYTCVKCKKEYGNQASAYSHYDAVHLDRTWKCNICNMATFTRNTNYYVHKKTCRETLQNRLNSLDEIKARECNPKYRFACPTCQKRFIFKCNLLEHQKHVHLNERKFSCNICNKTFKREEHMRIHKAESHSRKTLHCKLCKRNFSLNSRYHHHLKLCRRQKTGKKMSKTVAVSKTMYIKNLEDKTYDCAICKKKFRQVGNARRHYESIHIRRKNKCADCDVTFPQRVTLVNHKKKCKNGRKPTESLENK